MRIAWGEMTPDERSDVMLKARWNARQHAGETQVPASTRVLAIASGKGGVGKSSVTVNLAVALARQGRTVGVLDADIWGFSIPRLLGMTERLEAVKDDDNGRALIRPNELAVGAGRLKVVSTGFLVGEDTALMWRGLMLTKAVEQFLRDVQWGDLDDLLIDMPPGTGDVQMGLSRLLPRADMVIVTTPALAAQKVAQRAADMARRSFVRVVGVIENMSTFTCDHGERYELFGTGGGQTLADDDRSAAARSGAARGRRGPGGDAGRPVALADAADRGPAATEFAAIAARLDEVVPGHADCRRRHVRLHGPAAGLRQRRPRRQLTRPRSGRPRFRTTRRSPGRREWRCRPSCRPDRGECAARCAVAARRRPPGRAPRRPWHSRR